MIAAPAFADIAVPQLSRGATDTWQSKCREAMETARHLLDGTPYAAGAYQIGMWQASKTPYVIYQVKFGKLIFTATAERQSWSGLYKAAAWHSDSNGMLMRTRNGVAYRGWTAVALDPLVSPSLPSLTLPDDGDAFHGVFKRAVDRCIDTGDGAAR